MKMETKNATNMEKTSIVEKLLSSPEKITTMEEKSQKHNTSSVIACHKSTYCILTFYILFTILCIIDTSYACSCAPEHPQEQACRADFVILATVRKVYPVTKSGKNYWWKENGYHLKVRRIYKAPGHLRHLLQRHGRIITPSDSSAVSSCGVQLQVNHTYLLTGRSNEVMDSSFTDVCHQPLPPRWQVTEEHQDHLKMFAETNGCSCGLTKGVRGKLLRIARYTDEIVEPYCKIIKKGPKRFIRGAIKAKELTMNSCNFYTEFSQLSPRQWKGFQKLYYRGCDCNIGFLNSHTSRYQNLLTKPLGCMFKMDGKMCEYMHGICASSSQTGLCDWIPNAAQTKCTNQ